MSTRASRSPRGSRTFLKPATLAIISVAARLFGAYLFASLVIYLIESGSDDSLIKTYPQSLWYTLVTISTVGYGDLYPVSHAGRIAAGFLILVSVSFIGLVISKFGELGIERNRRRFLGMDGTTFTRHYIVIGWNDLSRIVIKEVMNAGFNVAVLASEEKDITEMRTVFTDDKRFFVTLGFTQDDDAYGRVNIADAAGAILLTGDDTTTLVTVLELKRLNPDLKVTAYIMNSQLRKTIENAGVSYVISPNEIVGRMIASAMFEPDVSAFIEDVLSTTTAENDLDVQEYRLVDRHELVGMNAKAAADRLEAATGARLLSFSRRAGGQWSLMKESLADHVLQADDYLLLLANHTSAQKVSTFLGVGQGRHE
jgi:voltage-gated potassium channel